MIKQVGGDHYEYGAANNQHWDLMSRWDIEYLAATASKYVVRCDRKGNEKQDLEKSISYLEKQLACFPHVGCRRTIPVEFMIGWYEDNDISQFKRLLLELIHVDGSPLALRSAIEHMRNRCTRLSP